MRIASLIVGVALALSTSLPGQFPMLQPAQPHAAAFGLPAATNPGALPVVPIPAAPRTSPTTYYVATTGNDNNNCLTPATACATINGAIGKANYGDIISIGAGIYHEHVVVNINLSLQGAGITKTMIDGSGTGTALTVQGSNNTVNVANLTVQDGSTSSQGAGVNNTAALTITNVLVTNNTFTVPNCYGFTVSGIGIYNSGTLYASDVTISNNSATNTICLVLQSQITQAC
jgi:hypothetical protein